MIFAQISIKNKGGRGEDLSLLFTISILEFNPFVQEMTHFAEEIMPRVRHLQKFLSNSKLTCNTQY